MSMFDDILKQVLAGAKDEAGLAAANFLKETTAQGTAFRADAEVNLARWQNELAAGEIDEDLFASLVRGQWDSAVLAALARAGKSGADARALAWKIVGIAVDAAISLIPGGPIVKTLTQVAVGAATAALAPGASVKPASLAAPAESASAKPRAARTKSRSTTGKRAKKKASRTR